MMEGYELFNVCLTERQMARITSLLARHRKGDESANTGDATILEVMQLAKPVRDNLPPKVKFYQCVSTTAEGLMQACLGALNGAFEDGSVEPDRVEMYEAVFAAAQKYYFKDIKKALGIERDAPGLGKSG